MQIEIMKIIIMLIIEIKKWKQLNENGGRKKPKRSYFQVLQVDPVREGIQKITTFRAKDGGESLA